MTLTRTTTDAEMREFRKHFSQGVKLICAKSVWDRMEARIREILGKVRKGDVTAFVHEPPEQFSRLEAGGMAASTMFMAMTELGWMGENLDPLPTLAEREAFGYRYLIYRMRGGKDDRPTEDKLIDQSIFLTIRSLIDQAIDPDRMTIDDWNLLRRERVSYVLGGGEMLRDLFYEWREAVQRALKVVPHKWLDK